MPEFADVSPTALIIAWLRSFTDQPFARGVAEATDAERVARELLASSGAPFEEQLRYAPFAEARYRCIDAALARLGLHQVLELAAGLVFRGQAMAADPQVVYVDSDLPGIVAAKRALVERMPALREHHPAGRIFYEAVDATRAEDVERAARRFDVERPLGVVNEGFLGYLALPEKAAVARNVRRLLERHGGAWVTTDLATQVDFQRHHAQDTLLRGTNAAIAARTGRPVEQSAFADDAHLERFFADLGFAVEARPQLDGSFTVGSLARLGLPPDMLVPFAPRVWTLTLR